MKLINSLFNSRQFIWFLNLINFDHKGFALYKPIVKNRFFFLYFRNKKFQFLTILVIETFSLFLFIVHINPFQFAYLYLLPVLILYIRNTKTYINLTSALVSYLKRSLIIKFLCLSLFIFFLYICYLNGAIRIFAVMIVTLIALLFEAYRNIRLKADVDKPYITKRVIQHEVSIRSEAELHLKYPFLKWFRKYVILRLMFCSSFYFMTKNGVILHEMLSVCALGFVWGAIQTNILQRYANTPVVLEVLADLYKVPWSKVSEALIKSNLRGNMGAKKALEFALKNCLIAVEQIEEVVIKTSKIVMNNKGASSIIRGKSQLLQEQAKMLPKVLEQNAKLESLVREQAKEHTRHLTSDRLGILISLALAGITIMGL